MEYFVQTKSTTSQQMQSGENVHIDVHSQAHSDVHRDVHIDVHSDVHSDKRQTLELVNTSTQK
uniref:Uncharacterized protein n=1 Tax=Arion vulgaris TaxID=1028688 RepID=A0A0B7BBS1_9EUPU